ncbi:hypothetical protein HBI56_188420 [Parastagonospora nodorum]|uniref:Kelch repeat protein n=1 Tax=Phaeosphaeria nodorum (strain SN15 / ATCC MYA-4574 / FGSC 10173) TaxID=321614 RepID=A0A7U2F9R4_PHANO|nr:hypothetical protein HBH56_146070 [Parastagonospora nodorum]QRD01289.1 hypothetical protein JI435_119700 [Parastagonospora nodorum SN15]KAH3927606.1 hypothetical protein HBH54_151260 [Parastagonospora nodorum]KAH3948096.1 hypothetical protein HBH53_111280 [Parastagonospora nodorum]KAH3971114.1 hypothetical protein HBH52_160230 [Parastagonospora nodorum]
MKGDNVYVFGGIRNFQHNDSVQWYDSSLLKLDLSKSWYYMENDPSIAAISSLNASYAPPPFLMYSSLTCDTDGNFHIDGGGLAMFNASREQPMIAMPIQNSSWTFWRNNSSWSPGSARVPESRYAPMHTLYTQAPEQDLVFYLNGILSNGSSERAYPKMMVLNTRTNAKRIVSTEIIAPSSARVGAVFQYMPLLGRKGGLILFGGATRYTDNITIDRWGTMEPLDMIHVFDIASLDDTPNGIWYHQRTTGRTPLSRISTCAIHIPSPDNTSYHIYMSSGRSPTEGYDDVWVLSLPQFLWTQVFAGARRNYGSTCHLVGKKQMLILGGNDWTKANRDPTIVAIYDMTNLKWLTEFLREDYDFRVPKAVWEWIGGSATGGATMREPEGGFASSGLARMFEGMAGKEGMKSDGSSARLEAKAKVVVLVSVIMTTILML